MITDDQFRDQIIRLICTGLPGPSACAAPQCDCYAAHGLKVFADIDFAYRTRQIERRTEYARVNPLGGPARIFETMAERIRAGEDYYAVIADYGFNVWKRIPEAVDDALEEVNAAARKFPTWPTDPLHALAVLGEEFGELTKDALQLTYEPHKTTMASFRKEAIQTAAMALRFVMSIDEYQFKQSVQHSQVIEGTAGFLIGKSQEREERGVDAQGQPHIEPASGRQENDGAGAPSGQMRS